MSDKARAFLIHLLICALVLGIVTCLIMFVWYPGPTLSLQGGRRVLSVILTADLTLGPILTGIVYAPRKKWLVFDIVVIVAAQLTALGYGLWVVQAQRPNYLAFLYDRFYIVSVVNTVGKMPGSGETARWRKIPLFSAPVTRLTTSESLDDSIVPSGENIVPPLAIVAPDLLAYPPSNEELFRHGADIYEIKDEGLVRWALSLTKERGLKISDVKTYLVVGRVSVGTALVIPRTGEILGILANSSSFGV